jgi:hypothetical protein
VENRKELIDNHFVELAKIYPDLTLEYSDEISIVQGQIDFIVPYKDIKIQDSFLLKIFIPSEYNKIPPNVKEIGGRIPDSFHKSKLDRFLCLEVPIEVQKKFSKEPSLKGFVKNLVVPYLFSFCYWEKYHIMPFGAHPHGFEGIIEYYKSIFNISSIDNIFNLLKILVTKNYQARMYCPCGSGKKFHQCHRKIILELSQFQSEIEFLRDFENCHEYLKKPEIWNSERYMIKNRVSS